MTARGIDFDRWAGTYDATRGVSPSVLLPLRDALGNVGGRRLLDIGGGTGNFSAALAAAGFRVTHSDLSPAMARRAAEKRFGAVCAADAQRLPFADASFDCEVSVNVARHLPDLPAAFAEARRVLRGGPFVLKVSTAETQRGDWVVEYLPRLLEHQPPYQGEARLADELRAAGFATVEVRRFVYRGRARRLVPGTEKVPGTVARPDGGGEHGRVPAPARSGAARRPRSDAP